MFDPDSLAFTAVPGTSRCCPVRAHGWSVSRPWSSVATGKSHFFQTRQQKVPSLLPNKTALKTVPAEEIRGSKEGYFWFPQLLRVLHSTETVPYLHCSSCTSCSGHAGPTQTPPAGWGWGSREPSPAETTTPHRKGLLFVLKEQKTNNSSSLCPFKFFSCSPQWTMTRQWCSGESTVQTLEGLADPSKMAENRSISQLQHRIPVWFGWKTP